MDNMVAKRIRQEIDATDVVLYMKGTPVFPQCGFSAAVIQVLSHMGVTAAKRRRAIKEVT